MLKIKRLVSALLPYRANGTHVRIASMSKLMIYLVRSIVVESLPPNTKKVEENDGGNKDDNDVDDDGKRK